MGLGCGRFVEADGGRGMVSVWPVAHNVGIARASIFVACSFVGGSGTPRQVAAVDSTKRFPASTEGWSVVKEKEEEK